MMDGSFVFRPLAWDYSQQARLDEGLTTTVPQLVRSTNTFHPVTVCLLLRWRALGLRRTGPNSMAFDGTNVWATNSSGNTINKL
jgi:hypothetical protein